MARTATARVTTQVNPPTALTPAVAAVEIEAGRRMPTAAGERLTGVVLIGTPSGLRQMAALLGSIGGSMRGSVERGPGVVGYVVVGADAAGRAFAAASASPHEDQLGEGELGEIKELPLLAARFGLRHALVCVPSGLAEVREAVFESVRRAGIVGREVRAVEDVLAAAPGPAVAERGTSTYVGAAPVVDLAALIGRTAHDLDRAAVAKVITGKRVLITGAGGSIGSELAKVAAGLSPEMLILMERGENALFEIDRLIGQRFPKVARRAVLHDVVDAEASMRLCEQLRPHAVFHAAAHKHVPLMEDHPAHAVTNNLFGTKAIADAAVAFGAERFVMISSDKAVNPTSVMGATKRLAELYVHGLAGKSQMANGQRANGHSQTRLSMVRFGNVLGSAASVLTIWSQQIAEGGPITITDPRMTRYFMTIPEAATLVVQSTVLGNGDAGAGVYVLDMGRPVRIVDLALRFARAHGLSPRVRWETAGVLGDDARREIEESSGVGAAGPGVDVVFTGIRPGEKLHEELAYAAEQLRPTAHPGVRSWAGPGFEAAKAADVTRMVRDLHAARHAQDRARVIDAIREHVPEMRTATPSGPAAGHPTAG